MKLRNILLAGFALCITAASAQSLAKAKEYYLNGEYVKALPIFKSQLKKTPKKSDINSWVGACLYETGYKDEAVSYLRFAASKSIASAYGYLAAWHLDNMEYEKAAECMDEYDDLVETELSNPAIKRARATMGMFNNVEKITIIDSLIVDKAEFFKQYKLSLEAGSLNSTDILPYEKPTMATSVFMPESKERMMWTTTDSVGNTVLAETYKLAGGKWDKYSYLPQETLNDNGDVNYPFMLADGTTLYYACNGDKSIGGYDIYMSRRNAATGEFLEPQNIGFPYNSPYDEYLLVIDEMTGVGWWASDRNQIEGKLTVYIFIPNEIRENYNSDEVDVYSLAAVKSIYDTQDEDADYDKYRQRISSIETPEEVEKPDFTFYIKNGVVYHHITDFNSQEAAALMEKRIKMENFLKDIKSQLTDLRAKYNREPAATRHKYSSKIVTLERSILKNNEELAKIDNEIRAAEIPTLKK